MVNEYLEYGLLIAITFAVVSVITYLLRRGINYFIQRNSDQLHVDPTNFIFLKNSISFIIYGIGILWIFNKIPYFKSLGTALFASAGVLAAVIGFASQKAVGNIIGGLFILIFKPFRVGDAIEISNGHKGVVEEITLRHTVIKDYEFRRVVVPNSIMSDDTIINSSITDKRIRKHIDIGIAYDADIDLAEKLLRAEIIAHPNYIDGRSKEDKRKGIPPVPIKVVSLGDFAVTLRAFVWTKDFDKAVELSWDIYRSVKKKFDEQGVEIPFPYRTIVFKDQSKLKDEQ